MTKRLPAALIVMDGFGIAEDGPGNAVSLARTPNLDALFGGYPYTTLRCSGLSVGLPEGQMGNSEVGHLNIGAGRVVYQEFTRVNLAIEDGSLRANQVLVETMDRAIESGNAIHFMGLLSDGGVHSHQEHLFALLEMAAARGASDIFVHAFLDGRDVPPRSGAGYLQKLVDKLQAIGVGQIASVAGRYWAMDRDNRWERVESAWRAIALGEGACALDPIQAVQASYSSDVTDEFVTPTVICDEHGKPRAIVRDGDALVFFNFRPDRAREITRAFVDSGFSGFARSVFPKTHFVCLTEYDPTINAPVAFPKASQCGVLADVLSDAGLRQLRIAETEKYAHVTFFFNGGSEVPREGERRILIPSPKVSTYDLRPEMSAFEVTDRLVAEIEAGSADVYIVNYANCDMVGHTGVLKAAVSAVEVVDTCVGRVVRAIREKGGVAIVTADHGNAERMLESDGSSPFTAHTSGEVPMCVVAEDVQALTAGGVLSDVAPTLLELISIETPAEWTGRSLLIY
ncbi:MAG: 2,3-bisphosphoglycerate-independent phosphoglycerate mutase [Actinobacteria bacterium]|nr:2,3-bisphosphoglycerate-independent phosphoglycerate mutase [Actinomycetota bacterium]